MIFMTRLLVTLSFLVTVTSWAAKDTFQMDADVMVEITSYDPSTQTYEVTALQYEGQGPLMATPESLAKAIPTLKLKRIKNDPNAIVGNQYKTDQKMTLLMPNAVKKRNPASVPEKVNSKPPKR